MYREEDEEDLRAEIFHLKRQLSTVTTENSLLKVRIRKLLNEIGKKDKQLDAIFDPKKSPDIRKIFYERSASFVLEMRERNDELIKLLQEKEIFIKRLQSQLEIAKLYSRKQQMQKVSSFKDNFAENTRRRENWTPDASTIMAEIKAEEGKNNIKDRYKSLSREHLLSIIENLKNNQRYSPSRPASSRKSSPESDLERIELLCESPHEEVQQLHLHFLDMISEVDYLKTTIAQLQNSQEKTDNVLKWKSNNFNKLAQEMQDLKRTKSKVKIPKNDVVRIYSGNKKTNEENFRKKNTNKSRSKMVNVMTQVEVREKPQLCVYMRNDVKSKEVKNVISQTSLSEETAYEEEVLDECDEESETIH